VSTTPGDLPPPPPAQPTGYTPTQIAGQETAPRSSVPAGPPGALGYTPATGQTNSLAVISLVAGIGSFFAHVIPGIGGFTVAIVAVVTGFMARNQIKQTGEQGMGLATAGIVIGLIHLALLVVGVLVLIFLIFVLGIALFGIGTHTATSGG
jgi:uncharacterized protein DUF4190